VGRRPPGSTQGPGQYPSLLHRTSPDPPVRIRHGAPGPLRVEICGTERSDPVLPSRATDPRVAGA